MSVYIKNAIKQDRDINPPKTSKVLFNLSLNNIYKLMGLFNWIKGGKPHQIITLEKEYNITLLELKKGLDIRDSESHNCYQLNHLGQIIGINLSNNQISNLKPLTDFIYLTRLNLANNIIREIDSIQNLYELTSLDLSNNQISNLLPITNLINLTGLQLDKNNITRLEPLINLKELSVLTLEENKIINLESLINLQNLTFLNLAKNQIIEISSLTNLTKLSRLDLRNNQISDIIALRGFFMKGLDLGYIQISENPIISPPLEIINQGRSSILRYFEQINQDGGTKTLFEAKITLVGEGGAGKTTLLRKLLNPNAEPPKPEARTRGIFIEDWEFDENNLKHVVHIWDFGGQDVYYPVHRFFLTENSVFILMASTRQNNHEFDYWIPTIFQFGGKSPIILAQTCHDGNTVEWNDIGAFVGNDNFNIIKDTSRFYHELNLLNNNKGLTEIKHSIISQIRQLPRFGKNVPKSWVDIRELIKELEVNNCIPFSDLKQKIFLKFPNEFRDSKYITDSIGFFHDIGILLWYRKEDRLIDWVIVNPKWAVDAVYKIIDDESIQNQKGNIYAADFKRVWDNKIYENKHEILKDMLAVFKIAFPKKSNPRDFIIPTRLKSMPSSSIWGNTFDCLLMEYQFNFMPKGMVNQISAELSRYIVSDDEVWNNGVNFIEGNTRSQVFEDFYNRKIIVKSHGVDSRGMMKIIMNAVYDICSTYKGVNPEIVIPCSCNECFKIVKNTVFPYDTLLRRIEKDEKATVTCMNSDHKFSIRELLFEHGLSNPKSESNALKVFISYSHNDTNVREEFQNYLINLEREGKIIIWCDEKLGPGDTWNIKTIEKLKQSDIIILMLSQSFIASKYIHEVEIRLTLQQKISGKSEIIPILLKPCDWQHWEIFKEGDKDINKEDLWKGKISHYQLAPIGDDNRLKAVELWPDNMKAKAWLQITDQIRNYCAIHVNS